MGNPFNYPPRFRLYHAKAGIPQGNTVVLGGVQYAAAPGTPLLQTAQIVLPNDRFLDCGHLAGPTTGRPNYLTDGDFAAIQTGTVYLDTTINAAVIFDGVNWRNAITGAIS